MTVLVGVPHIELGFKHVPGLAGGFWRCTDCEMPFRGMTLAAVEQAFEDHVRYVNTLPKDDCHFEDLRLALLVDR